jgi:hypothetical protein
MHLDVAREFAPAVGQNPPLSVRATVRSRRWYMDQLGRENAMQMAPLKLYLTEDSRRPREPSWRSGPRDRSRDASRPADQRIRTPRRPISTLGAASVPGLHPLCRSLKSFTPQERGIVPAHRLPM